VISIYVFHFLTLCLRKLNNFYLLFALFNKLKDIQTGVLLGVAPKTPITISNKWYDALIKVLVQLGKEKMSRKF
jgi:hypothetical protein